VRAVPIRVAIAVEGVEWNTLWLSGSKPAAALDVLIPVDHIAPFGEVHASVKDGDFDLFGARL